MAFPIGALIAVAPQIIKAVGSLLRRDGRAGIHPKVRVGGQVGAIVGAVLVFLSQIPGAPEVLGSAYVAAWIKSAQD
jgi:hypothetical protein